MEKIKKTLLLFSLVIGTVILTACGEAVADQNIAQRIESSEEPVITWGTKADTALLGIYDVEQGEIVGFDVDIAKALTDEITDGKGRAEIIEATSKTRIPLLKNGNIDAIAATLTITDDRKEVVDFSDVYFDGGQSILVHEDSEIQSVHDLTSEHTVIGIKGSTSVQNFRDVNPDPQVIELENYSEGFVALQSGQGDALTTDSAMLLGMIEQNPNYRIAGENFVAEPYGIGVNKGQEEFLNQIDEALDTIQANGVYDEIYEKWFGDLYPAQEPGSPSTSTTEYANPDGVESTENEQSNQ